MRGSGPQSLVTCKLYRQPSLSQFLNWGEKGITSGCALMIAIRRVRCGSSVYVQKKSCSLTSSGGGASASGELRNRAAFASLGILEVVMVDVEAGILKD